MYNKIKKEEVVNNSNQPQNQNPIKTMKEYEFKLISFEELRLLSNQNFGKYNRNINWENILRDVPNIQNWNMLIKPLMVHEHFMGERIETHLRCVITHGISLLTTDKEIRNKYCVPWFQDLSFEQWGMLREFKKTNEN